MSRRSEYNYCILQSAWQTFKLKNGNTVEEKITVNNESVNIQVPNKMNAIYDYEQVHLIVLTILVTKHVNTL